MLGERLTSKFNESNLLEVRDNMVDSEDTNIITKKFFSYVKSTFKSNRIPECVSNEKQQRYAPKDQAELFNDFFSSIFPCPSL